MPSEDRLQDAFVGGLGLTPPVDWSALEYRGIPQWDSVAHMQLISEIEDAFDVMLDTQDVIGMSSYVVAKDLLGKYGVTFD